MAGEETHCLAAHLEMRACERYCMPGPHRNGQLDGGMVTGFETFMTASCSCHQRQDNFDASNRVKGNVSANDRLFNRASAAWLAASKTTHLFSIGGQLLTITQQMKNRAAPFGL